MENSETFNTFRHVEQAPPAEEQVKFLLFIQRLLQEGMFTSSYKFALLQAIANLCVEKFVPGETLELNAREIAEQFIRFYWRQRIPFRGTVLKQNNGNQAAVITYIESAALESAGSLAAFKSNAGRWNSLVAKVARTIVEMPLWKLQNLGGESVEYLYSRGASRSTIVLSPGVPYCFRIFHGLVSELVQSAWTAFIRRQVANREVIGPESDLQDFLFGTDRKALAKFAPVLMEEQSGACFYCRRNLRGEACEVDHFIPWSRYSTDLGHNFVLAHGTCNRDKLDRLAGQEFLERWTERNLNSGPQLADEFRRLGLLSDLKATDQIAYFAYEQAEMSGAAVWCGRPNMLATLTADWRRYFNLGRHSIGSI